MPAPPLFSQLAHEGDDEGSIAAISDQAEGEYYEIDPLEKEWMLAATHADMESIHRLIMADPSLINRKDFIQVCGVVSHSALLQPVLIDSSLPSSFPLSLSL